MRVPTYVITAVGFDAHARGETSIIIKVTGLIRDRRNWFIALFAFVVPDWLDANRTHINDIITRVQRRRSMGLNFS